MAREHVWHTLVAGFTNQSDLIAELIEGPCTVQRIIGTLVAGRIDSGVGPIASFHYVVNVGTAAADPNAWGEDPPDVMLHGAILLPNPTTAPIRVEPAAPQLVSEGQRVVGAGESLWLRIRGGVPASAWTFAYSIRVLVLTPDA